MKILRGVVPQDRNAYYVCVNSVKTTDKWRESAHYLSRDAAENAANFLCGNELPFLPIFSMADFYTTPQEDINVEQLFVLQNISGVYFVAATYDGGVELTSDIDGAAHYLTEQAAQEAADMLETFDLEFSVETHGFWSDV